MRPPIVRPHIVYCGNPNCASRRAGRTFKVIDTTDMSDSERAELLIDGADTFKWDEYERVVDGKRVVERVRRQTSEAKPRFDGELKDGEVWLCSDCRGGVS